MYKSTGWHRPSKEEHEMVVKKVGDTNLFIVIKLLFSLAVAMLIPYIIFRLYNSSTTKGISEGFIFISMLCIFVLLFLVSYQLLFLRVLLKKYFVLDCFLEYREVNENFYGDLETCIQVKTLDGILSDKIYINNSVLDKDIDNMGIGTKFKFVKVNDNYWYAIGV